MKTRSKFPDCEKAGKKRSIQMLRLLIVIVVLVVVLVVVVISAVIVPMRTLRG